MTRAGDPIKIRRAQQGDITGLVALIASLFEQEQEFAPDASAQRSGLDLLLGASGRARILVAERGSRLVGMVTLQLVVSTALGAPVGLLEDMVVDPTARGQGVGGALVAHIVEEAELLGCRRITLLTDGDNTAARRFYERHGFVQSSMSAMRIGLPR